MKNNPCPFCNVTKIGTQSIDEHIWFEHLGYSCWCGLLLSDCRDFRRHLRGCGLDPADADSVFLHYADGLMAGTIPNDPNANYRR